MKSLQTEHDKCKDLLSDANNNESWKEEVEAKNQRIVQLERQLIYYEALKDDTKHNRMNKDIKTRAYKNRQTLEQITDSKEFSKNHAEKMIESREKDNDEKMSGEAEESWTQEIEAKNQRIAELKQEMALLENFLRENVDTQRLHDLEKKIERKSKRTKELEDAVEELEGFLKDSVKEIRDLHHQMSFDKERIVMLEKWIQKNNLLNVGIDKARIIELEEMVTNLENYVKEHNVDSLKRTLQDRECRINQLENQIVDLGKKLLKFEKNQTVSDTLKKNSLSDDRVTWEIQKKEEKIELMDNTSKEDFGIQQCEQQNKILEIELREKERKIKEMGHDISEKNNMIQEYEQQVVEQQNKILKMEKEITELMQKLDASENVNALKEKIRIRNKRVEELEIKVDSLEILFVERINVAMKELTATLKEKEKIEFQLKEDLADKKRKIKELDMALYQNIAVTNEIEKKFTYEKKLRKEANQKIAEFEDKITLMHTLTTKCITCQPLIDKILKTEEELFHSNQEEIVELEKQQQTKNESLKTHIEKDTPLVLLNHTYSKTSMEAEQTERLKSNEKILFV
ncbi:golgin subfamily A member 6-like protein 25 [Linepithema humile]|uniref:golgin subfamily A member 6-like protein 25 n=1 Tax=Linepithema humile TaxID=83485 RepID=UPI00062355E8|nr:PREDICTED: restin homolog [Linepithema humile]